MARILGWIFASAGGCVAWKQAVVRWRYIVVEQRWVSLLQMCDPTECPPALVGLYGFVNINTAYYFAAPRKLELSQQLVGQGLIV